MEIKSFQLSTAMRYSLSVAMLFLFTFLTTSINAEESHFFFTETSENTITKDTLVEFGPTLKMMAIPDEEVQNQAVLTFLATHDEATFLVFDLNGILQKEELYYVVNNEKNTVKLDLSEMRSGTYYIVHDQSKGVAPFNVE